ncbi:PEP-CTERM sorting domain-containing protein [Candidatus Uabimicrobium amorphum]|uniref:PEP-CTERM sorting domain-containing protein n=1 Tax=Uabimicrobium amorphum TaxID=2596890 RepID=UPI00125F8E10
MSVFAATVAGETFVDNVSFSFTSASTVPEPSTYIAFLFGILAIGYLRKRK